MTAFPATLTSGYTVTLSNGKSFGGTSSIAIKRSVFGVLDAKEKGVLGELKMDPAMVCAARSEPRHPPRPPYCQAQRKAQRRGRPRTRQVPVERTELAGRRSSDKLGVQAKRFFRGRFL